MTTWTVLRTAHPESSNLTVPGEVQQLLGLEADHVVLRSQLERNLVFLWRPNGWCRVVPAFYFADLVAKEAQMDRVLAHAPITATSTGSLVLNLPLRVVHYLHLKDFHGAEPSPRTPMDSTAWITPKKEWDTLRWEGELGFPLFKAGHHVYLAHDAFEGAWPKLEVVEDPKARPKPETVSVRIGPTPPKKDRKRERASRPYG